MEKVSPILRSAASIVDPSANDLTSAVLLWVTPTDRSLGFVSCVQPEDRADIAALLREHALSLSHTDKEG